MADKGKDARARLQEAGLALFAEHGYERTTAAEIAARAGVTERTFFRHFPDKREVLFDGQALLRAALCDAIDKGPGTLGPLAALFAAFRCLVPMLEANRAFAEPRQRVIAATPALQERELTKLAALSDALAGALEARGVPALPALLAARVGMAAFAHVAMGWLDRPEPNLAERLDDAEAALRTLLADG